MIKDIDIYSKIENYVKTINSIEEKIENLQKNAIYDEKKKEYEKLNKLIELSGAYIKNLEFIDNREGEKFTENFKTYIDKDKNQDKEKKKLEELSQRIEELKEEQKIKGIKPDIKKFEENLLMILMK